MTRRCILVRENFPRNKTSEDINIWTTGEGEDKEVPGEDLGMSLEEEDTGVVTPAGVQE